MEIVVHKMRNTLAKGGKRTCQRFGGIHRVYTVRTPGKRKLRGQTSGSIGEGSTLEKL